MYLGIIAPSLEEFQYIDKFLVLKAETSMVRDGYMLRSGFLDNQLQDRVVLALSGMGKANAAMTTQFMIDEGCKKMILFGVAGTIAPENLPSTDGIVIVPTSIRYFDADDDMISTTDPFKDTFEPDPEMIELITGIAKEIDGLHPQYVPMASGDKFLQAKGLTKKVKKDTVAVDMESAAFAHTCARNSIPFIVIRGLSDSDHNTLESPDAERAALLTACLAYNMRRYHTYDCPLRLPDDVSLRAIDLHKENKYT